MKFHKSIRNNTLLWRLKLPGQVQNSYLLGTVHIKDNLAFERINTFESYIHQCQIYAGEMDLDESHKIGGMKIFMPNGQTISSLLGPKKFFRFSNVFLKKTGFNLKQYDRLYPMLISNILTESMMGKDHQVSLDQKLWSLAQSAGIETIGIESFLEQEKTFSQIKIKTQLRFFSKTMSSISGSSKSIKSLLRHYQNGHVNQLAKGSKKSLGEIRKLLLYQRNAVMASRISSIVEFSTAFISIGAAHLGGGKGVLRQLKRLGLNLEPLPW